MFAGLSGVITSTSLALQQRMSKTARIAVISVLWTALQLSACSALIDVSGRQCETDMQCREQQLGDVCVDHVCQSAGQSTNTLEGANRDTRCVKESDCSGETPRCMRNQCVSQAVAEMFLCRAPEAPPVGGGTVKYSFTVVEFVSRLPPANLTARACRGNDVKCVDAIPALKISPEDGTINFVLPLGFLGFFEVQSDALPALSYLTKPILVDTVDRPLQLSSPDTFMGLAMLDGAEIQDGTGVALLEAFDCKGTPVGGVHFEASVTGVRPFYIVNHVPNHAVAVSALDAVNNVADGGFLNVAPGFVTFTARYGVGGPVLGAFNVSVRPGTFTFIDMYF
jgi:hypothetical protein